MAGIAASGGEEVPELLEKALLLAGRAACLFLQDVRQLLDGLLLLGGELLRDPDGDDDVLVAAPTAVDTRNPLPAEIERPSGGRPGRNLDLLVAVVAELGVAGVFPTGSKFGEVVSFIREKVQR